jgi:hypothetical protein
MNQNPETEATYIESLERRVEMLEAGLAGLLKQSTVSASSDVSNLSEQRDSRSGQPSSSLSRRKLLTGAAVSAAGAGAFLLRAQPAAAATGNNFILGTANDANVSSSLANSAASSPAVLFTVTNSGGAAITASSGPNFDGLSGTSTSGASGAGVAGTSPSGYGLYGDSTSGYALFAGGNGRIGMNAHLAAGAPISGTYSKGDIVRDANAALYLCVVGGTPGTWKKVAGPDTSQLYLLPSPVRSIDTRAGQQPATFNGPKGQLTASVNRSVDLKQGTQGSSPTLVTAAPAGATGALINIIIVDSSALGWIAVWQDGLAYPGHSNVNTFGPGQTLAATTVTALDPITGQCQIRSAMACDVVIDVLGYYR